MHTQHTIMHSQHNIAAKHAMQTLTALKEPGQNFAGGILFRMLDRPTCVLCWVSGEALARIARGNSCQQGPMECFERHRPEIERLASQKYDAGERSPVVMSFDFEHLR